MSRDSIDAYDLPTRVASYDSDMEVMHPLRTKMVQVALDILPMDPDSELRALDLGIGTGLFAERLLSRYPQARVVAVDGAASMVELAKTRLGDRSAQVDFRIGDFRDLGELLSPQETFDVVISAYALHHLNGQEKEDVVRECVGRLRQGGWFLNADLIDSVSPELEKRYQALRIRGILERASSDDERFQNASTTRRFLDDLEEREGDQPRALARDLETLRAAGLSSVSALWVEYREAVMVGIKP